jgi:hypothetical protein
VFYPLDSRTGKTSRTAIVEFPSPDVVDVFYQLTKGRLKIENDEFVMEKSLNGEEWSCHSCNVSNFGSRVRCRGCGSRKPATRQLCGLGTSSISTEWEEQVSKRIKAEEILQMCPALQPFNELYIDAGREWLFNPDTLIWYSYTEKEYYRLHDEEQMLIRVDKTGNFCFHMNERRPLPKNIGDAACSKQSASSTPSRRSIPVNRFPDQALNIPGPVMQSIICALCKRKFRSLEALRKHENLSELHRGNLSKLANLE